MKRCRIAFVTALAVFGVWVGAAANATGQMGKMDQPNILFIIIDDMGWKDIGISGSTYYETPNGACLNPV